MKDRELLAQYAYACNGDWVKIAEAIRNEASVSHFDIQEKYITIMDSTYPESLKKLRYPPWVLFYKGNIALLKRRKVTIVGSREMTDYGRMVTTAVTGILKKRYVIVSGLAKGVDGAAHTEAMDGGYTIGVIGSGLSTQYPSCNLSLYTKMEQDHLILSEYPSSVGVKKYHFPWRNRILAALGSALFVTQARIQSGTMHTVNEAIALSKEVWCVPYRIDEEEGFGCNKLISEGAYMLADLKVLNELQFHDPI